MHREIIHGFNGVRSSNVNQQLSKSNHFPSEIQNKDQKAEMKKVLIISTSPRHKSNPHALAEEFARGAKEAGHEVELVTLRDKDLRFCQGCLACTAIHRCVIHDDAPAITAKMHDADIIAWATPIYYYKMSGQMKTMIDRGNPLYDSDYRFTDIYMLSSAAEDEAGVPDRAISGLQGWIDCFERAHLAGSVFAGGAVSYTHLRAHETDQ